MAGFRMEKSHLFISGSGKWFFMDQFAALFLCLCQLLFHIRGAVGYMVQSFTAFVQEDCDGAVIRCWFQQLNMGFPESQKSGTNFLGGDFFFLFTGES